MASKLNVCVLSVRFIILISTSCSISPEGSSSESAVEEETLGLSVPNEEEEGSVGHELDDVLAGTIPNVDDDGSGCTRFCSLLVHVYVGLMEDIGHPYVIAAGDVTEFGFVCRK